jgi:hypothetical protein
MSASLDGFDLDAAALRRSETDIRAFLEALAVRLEGALPGRVRVERKRDGLLSKTSHVAQITVEAQSAVLVLQVARGQLSATRAKQVRGVTISSGAIGVPEWLAAVRAEVQVLAEQAGAAGDTLHDFL